jgi:hypothetical protein
MQKNHRRFVAHFDMLGMKQAVLQNVHEAWGALCDINEAKKRIYKLTIEIEPKQIIENRVHTFFFSDTVIIFTLSDNPVDLHAILILSAEFFSNSLHRCVPLRGGIAHGDFLFNLDENIFLGEPLIRAYEVGESAQFMGIIVDQFVAKMSERYTIGENITLWDVPQKDKRLKKEYVLNWPKIFRNNFTVRPVTVDAFYDAFEPLFGPYADLTETARIKYENTVTFINEMLDSL